MPFEITAQDYAVTITAKVPATLTLRSARRLNFTIDTGTEQVTVKSIIVSTTVTK